MFIKLFVARIKDVFAAADIPSPVRKPTQLPGAPPPGLRPAAQICSVYHPRWSETRRGHNSLPIIPVGRRPDGGTTAFASSPWVGDQTGARLLPCYQVYGSRKNGFNKAKFISGKRIVRSFALTCKKTLPERRYKTA